jgi:hypothetical protein
VVLGSLLAAAGRAEWRTLSPGLELGSVVVDGTPPAAEVTVVRVDPAEWEIGLHCASAHDLDAGRTAREWCDSLGLAAAINAGMYATDARTHVGYLRDGAHVNSARRNSYQSVAVFRPRTPGAPAFRIVDLDLPGASFDSLLARYDGLVQNLRLIRRPRENRWSPLPKTWSEAALGEDEEGRALLLFCRTPLSMHDFNAKLLAAEELKLVCAQHLEGGRQAQLFVRAGDVERELVGESVSGLTTDESPPAWPIPNVLGIRRRS